MGPFLVVLRYERDREPHPKHERKKEQQSSQSALGEAQPGPRKPRGGRPVFLLILVVGHDRHHRHQLRVGRNGLVLEVRVAPQRLKRQLHATLFHI
jgi:hypothetical protein